MHFSLLQSAAADVATYLHKLESGLPRDLVSRVEILDTSADDGDGLPRVVAVLPDANAAEADMIKAAFARVGAPEFDLMCDRALPERYEIKDQARNVLPGELPWMPATRSAPLEPDVRKLLRQLIDPSVRVAGGSDFPEDNYEGRHKTAYDHIVKTLGIAPNADPSRTVSEARLTAIKRPRGVSKTVWEEVVTHLCQEVRFLALADKWWGPTGLWDSVYSKATTFNLLFIDTAVSTYKLELKPNAMVTMFLDKSMVMTITAIKAIPDGGAVLAEIVSLLWSAAKASAGNGEVQGEVARIKAGIAPYFEETLAVLGATHRTTCGSWAALSEFGARVEAGEIVSPDDTLTLIRPHTLGFQYEALRGLIAVASKTNSSLPFMVWGIAKRTKHSDKPRQKADFDSKTKRWRTKTRSRCIGPDEYDEFFVGLWRDPPTGSGVHTEQFLTLSEKMFGADDKASDPGLALPPKILADLALRQKLGWSINSA